MAVRTTLPDAATATAAAAIVFLISLQFAASRTPSSLNGNAVPVPVSEPEAEYTATRTRTRIRLPSETIKDEPELVSVPASEPEREREIAAPVRAVPLTRLRFNDLRSIDDQRYFVERFGFPGRRRDCRHHHHGSERDFPMPVVTEIIRYVDEPVIPMEIIRYVDDTSAPAKPKKEVKVEPEAKTSGRAEADFAKYMVDEETAAGKAAQSAKEEMKVKPIAETSRVFPKPVEAQLVEPEFAKYVDEAEVLAAKAAQYKDVKPAANVEIVKYADAVAAAEATAAMIAAKKKELKTESAAEASVTGSPVHRTGSETDVENKDVKTAAAADSVSRSRYSLHRGSSRAGMETVRYRDAAAATEAAKPKKDDEENKEAKVNRDDGFSKYMMKYNSRNFQKFGHQKFVRHLPHKREEEKKGEFTRIVKRIRKFLEF